MCHEIESKLLVFPFLFLSLWQPHFFFVVSQRVFGVTHSIHNLTIGKPDETQQYLWSVGKEWKFIQRYQGKDTTRYRNVHAWDTAPVRLFNIHADPFERNDLAEERADMVERKKLEIEDWRRGLRPSGNSENVN